MQNVNSWIWIILLRFLLFSKLNNTKRSVSTAESSVSHEYTFALPLQILNLMTSWKQWWATDDDAVLMGSVRFSELHYRFGRRTLNIYHQQSITRKKRRSRRSRANNLCNGRDGLRRAWSKIQIKRLIQPPPFHRDWQTRAMGLFLISDLLSSFCQGFSGDWEAGEFDNPGSDIFSLLKPQEQSSLLTFGKDTRVTFF